MIIISGAGVVGNVVGGSGDGARVARTTSQTITTATDTAISFDTEVQDDGGTPGYFDAAAPTRLTAGEDGYYLVSVTARLSDGTNAMWKLFLEPSNSSALRPSQGIQMDADVDDTTTAAVFFLAAGDYVEAKVRHDETNDEEVESATFSIAKIGTVGAVVTRAAVQSVATGTPTALSFDTEVIDDNAFFSGGDPTKLTAPSTGWYVIGCYANRAGSNSALTILEARLNGATILAGQARDALGTFGDCDLTFAYHLTAGDFIEFLVTQQSGGNRDFIARAWIAERASGSGAFVTRAATQSMATGTTAFQFTAEVIDNNSFWDAGSNTRITIPSDGWYLIGGYCHITLSTQFYGSHLRLNGSTQEAGSDNGQNSSTQSRLLTTMALYFTATDYIEFMLENPSIARAVGPINMWVLALG